MKKVWNGKLSGLLGGLYLLIGILADRILNLIFFNLHKGNLNHVGTGTYFYRDLTYRFPNTISIGNNCIINRKVNFVTELEGSNLIIKNNVSVAPSVTLDYTGGLEIFDDVTISRAVSIFTHDHGMDPRSIPSKKPLTIQKNVWIGVQATILQNVEYIGENSVIAAGAVVTKNVEPNSVIGGNPGKLLKYL